MRTRTVGLAVLLLAAATAGRAAAQAPNYAPPDPVYPLPLYHDRPETGGLYAAGEFMFFRQTNPLAHQLIARRGLVDFDGSIIADLGGTVIEPINGEVPPFILPGQLHPGQFIGDGKPVLWADDAGGPGTYQPGFNLTLGWRFRNGVALETSWMHLQEAKYSRSISGVSTPDFSFGQNLENTFLFSPVTNFPNDFAGPSFKLALGNPLAAYGIWNGATLMQVTFLQRLEQWDTAARIPIYESDDCRCYGILGPRLVWFWERFRWRTVSQDFTGNAGQDDVALYNNVVSNRLYGVHIGMGNEWRLGDSPIGTFSFSVDLQAAVYCDVVKERASYERGDFEMASKRSRTEFTIVPELEAKANLWYYPIEGIQLRIGYNVMGFFNTVASPNPVSFDFGALDPPWEKGIFRFLDGFDAGIGLIF